MAVVARLCAYSRHTHQPQGGVALETFSDYHATHRRNPAWRAGGAARSLPFFIPTGTWGWEEWAMGFLDLTTQYGVIHLTGPGGISQVEVFKEMPSRAPSEDDIPTTPHLYGEDMFSEEEPTDPVISLVKRKER